MKPLIAGWIALAGGSFEILQQHDIPVPVKVSTVIAWIVCAIVGTSISYSHARIRAAQRHEPASLPRRWGWLWFGVRSFGMGVGFGPLLDYWGVDLRLQGVGVLLMAMVAELVIEGIWKLFTDIASDPVKWVKIWLRRYNRGRDDELEETLQRDPRPHPRVERRQHPRPFGPPPPVDSEDDDRGGEGWN